MPKEINQLSPSEVLDERISDILLKRDYPHFKHNLEIILKMCALATATVYRAGAAGNVQCKQSTKDLLILQSKLK